MVQVLVQPWAEWGEVVLEEDLFLVEPALPDAAPQPGDPKLPGHQVHRASLLLMGLDKVEMMDGLLEYLTMKPKGWSFLQDLRSSERRAYAIPDILHSRHSENPE